MAIIIVALIMQRPHCLPPRRRALLFSGPSPRFLNITTKIPANRAIGRDPSFVYRLVVEMAWPIPFHGPWIHALSSLNTELLGGVRRTKCRRSSSNVVDVALDRRLNERLRLLNKRITTRPHSSAHYTVSQCSSQRFDRLCLCIPGKGWTKITGLGVRCEIPRCISSVSRRKTLPHLDFAQS